MIPVPSTPSPPPSAATQPTATLSDEAILARVVAGDAPSFELLMRRHNQRLYRTARSVLHDESEAEDVVQETFVRAYTNLSRFEGRSSVATWLTRIAFHEALRQRRRNRRALQLAGQAATERAIASPGEDNDARKTGPMASTSYPPGTLSDSLDSLPPELRSVVMLRLVQGLSTRETAECLRISEANVKVRLHRARHLLLDSLQRRLVPELAEQYTFGSERCDRVVKTVFQRLALAGITRERPTPDV